MRNGTACLVGGVVILSVALAGCVQADQGTTPSVVANPDPTNPPTTSRAVSSTTSTPTTTTTTTTTAPGIVAPSQSIGDAARDGIIPAIAELSYVARVRSVMTVDTDEGAWVASELSRSVVEATPGCEIGDLEGEYPIDFICTYEYGELLLTNDGEIVKAFPLPASPLGWLHVTDSYVYAGRIGDGGLPDSTLVRVDRESLDVTVVVIPLEPPTGQEWMPSWFIAHESYQERHLAAVHINTDGNGTTVESWIKPGLTVDIEAVDAMIAEVAGN